MQVSLSPALSSRPACRGWVKGLRGSLGQLVHHLLKLAILAARLSSLFTRVLYLKCCVFSCQREGLSPSYLLGGFWGKSPLSYREFFKIFFKLSKPRRIEPLTLLIPTPSALAISFLLMPRM